MQRLSWQYGRFFIFGDLNSMAYGRYLQVWCISFHRLAPLPLQLRLRWFPIWAAATFSMPLIPA